jgi:hypothetical protein
VKIRGNFEKEEEEDEEVRGGGVEGIEGEEE